jgi:tetratricopeptide (TPR) repeat protein
MRRALLSAFVCAVSAAALHGQAKTPLRPMLSAGADTNDAQSYYELGMALVAKAPEKAADAFYWSTQLDPASADAFYARRVALLMANPQRLVGYWTGDRRALRDKNVMAADSLYLRALTINPFLYRKLDAVFFDAIIKEIAADAAGSSASRGEVEHEIDRYLAQAPADLKAWQAYSSGRFDEALRQYAIAIKQARKKAGLRLERGRLFIQLNQPDSALGEIKLASEELRKADKKDLVFVYDSKALVEQALGMSYLKAGQKDQAREAFARALQEDLSYGPAHVQLGIMALDARDTAAAVSEFDLAVQIAPNDPVLRYQYAFTLEGFGKPAEAEAQLRKAIELTPSYSSPHFLLGKTLKTLGKKEEAAASLRKFLALASRNDPRRSEATQMLTSLGTSP